jgi:hypothetical protein
MTELILHHYPLSPCAEKIRAGLGIKKLAWRSVEHNRMPDRPELFAMTGGYRRTPVMQVGADIYCDTQCILRKMERRAPSPTFFPNNDAGLPFALSRWTDGPLFELAFCTVFAPAAHTLPPALVAEALAIAKSAVPQTAEKSDPRDPQGLKPGMRIAVRPITDSGDPAVAGVVRAVDRNVVTLTREDPACGVVAVHFPRVGYRVTVLTDR